MKTPTLTKQELQEAITEGVYRAFWDMITNATDMPCADFYAAVQNGVKEAMSSAGINIRSDNSEN
jgi:hypothetical protein